MKIVANFFYAWIFLTISLTLHVLDEAQNDFLSIYNPLVSSFNENMKFSVFPVFSFSEWLTGLIIAIIILFGFSFFAYRKKKWILYSLALLKKVFGWAREVNPSQPLTTGIWHGDVKYWGDPDKLPALDRYMVEHSDIISFHTYDGNMEVVKQKISALKKYGRPLLCTEYLARARHNLFTNVLPIFKEQKIAAYRWGFVSGKTNTIYPWSSWQESFTSEPAMWHHDILRKDGAPFSKDEIAFIKQMTDNN